MKRAALLFVSAIAAAALASASGCAAQSEPVYTFPSEKQFVDDGVSEFLERRCGTMDCHGQVGRPLRLYAKDGLRLATSPERDTKTTTDAERKANYVAVIGLEPEELSLSVQSKGEYVDFMLFKKPLGEEGGGVKHKGGPVLAATQTDPGWVCLRSWVAGSADKAKCAAAATALDPNP